MTNENHEENRPKLQWEKWGTGQQQFQDAVHATIHHNFKLDEGIDQINQALDFLGYLRDDEEITMKSLNLADMIEKALRKAEKKLSKFAKQQHKRNILGYSKPRNLSHGDDREDEQRELVRRLHALPYRAQSDVITLACTLELLGRDEDTEKQNELLDMMETQPLSYVIAYDNLSEKGMVQLTNGEGAPSHA